MNKSIETVWKEGFADESQLTAPKINDLYNRKSENIVDKLQRMFAVNIKALMAGSIVMLIAMSMIGAPFLGLYFLVLLIPLIVIAKKELNKSYKVSKGASSYEYIKGFDQWLQSSIKVYGRYYQWAYPLIFVGMVTQGLLSDIGMRMLGHQVAQLPASQVFLGVPYYIWLAIMICLLLVVKYANALYRLDLHIVYGKQFKRLKELMADMEELRA